MTAFFQVAPSSNPQAARLFCVPHAGVGASAFRGWKELLEPEIEVLVVQLPGRESRYRETPYRDLGSLTRDLSAAVLPYIADGQRFAFFGNSLGGLVSFETLHAIKRRAGLQAMHLFVAASGAPHLPPLMPPVGHLGDRELIRDVSQQYGGIPAEVLRDEEFLAFVVPGLRADMLLLETYERREPDPLSCPITAFGGTRDRAIPVEYISGWGEQTTAAFNHFLLDQEHLFLQSAKLELVAHVREQMLAAPCLG
jgi:medium-chain acyl-[acyl-carrier-protein] hydrolase